MADAVPAPVTVTEAEADDVPVVEGRQDFHSIATSC